MPSIGGVLVFELNWDLFDDNAHLRYPPLGLARLGD